MLSDTKEREREIQKTKLKIISMEKNIWMIIAKYYVIHTQHIYK